MAIQTTKLSEVEIIESAVDPKLVIEDEGEIKRISPEAIAPSYIQNKPESLGGSCGGFMEVDIVLSDSNFYSGTVTFSKTYEEIKSAIEKGYCVIGWLKTNQFKGDVYYHYSNGYMRPLAAKYVPDINGGIIFFICSNPEVGCPYIQADGTTDIYFD